MKKQLLVIGAFVALSWLWLQHQYGTVAELRSKAAAWISPTAARPSRRADSLSPT